VCVSVCVRDRETNTHIHTERDRERDRDRQTDRVSERVRENAQLLFVCGRLMHECFNLRWVCGTAWIAYKRFTHVMK